MKRTAPDEEFTEAWHRTPQALVDPQTFRLGREFIRAHGLTRGPLTTLLPARDISIERLRDGVNLE